MLGGLKKLINYYKYLKIVYELFPWSLGCIKLEWDWDIL